MAKYSINIKQDGLTYFAGKRRATPIFSSRFAILAGVLAGCLALSACTDKTKKVDVALAERAISPSVAYQKVELLVKKGDLGKAAKALETLAMDYPNTEWARKAMIQGAALYYKAKDFDNTAQLARRYALLYPSLPNVDYALYLVGLAAYSQMVHVSRDQSAAEKVIASMEGLIKLFPNSQYAPDARAKIQVALSQLAAKELDVGRYYAAKKQYVAAINRYQTIVDKYASSNQLPEALYRLAEANYALGLVTEAKKAAARLEIVAPGTIWDADAKYLLAYGQAPQWRKNAPARKLPLTVPRG